MLSRRPYPEVAVVSSTVVGLESMSCLIVFVTLPTLEFRLVNFNFALVTESAILGSLFDILGYGTVVPYMAPERFATRHFSNAHRSTVATHCYFIRRMGGT
jgi:hypothetical protein